MQSKSLLIAIAAFAVTATGVQAYVGNKQLNRAGFSSTQIEAFVEARQLKARGETDKARDVLLKAGVDEEKLEALRKVSHASHYEFHQALTNSDYDNFIKAIEGTPLADIITNKSEFLQFKSAHDLKSEGKYEDAKVILDELGVPNLGKHGYEKRHNRKDDWLELTDVERDALRVARQANDYETMRAILSEAGIEEKPMKYQMRGW